MSSGISSGTRLGRYEIRSQIGAGGMGEVYLARDTRLGRTVALKLLRADVASDRQRMHRFEKEAKAASALNHPNIITIYEIDQTSEAHFIAMEFIEGETLRAAMAGASLETSKALDVAAQVASALAAAHDAGIVHRDIKPENIMLRMDGYVKVLDFGLVKLTERYATHSELTMIDGHGRTAMADTDPGMVMGTVHYMSPEQAQGQPVDARTDIWSLGVLLYKMLTGSIPFRGKTPNHVIVSIIEDEPQPITNLMPDVPAELQRIVTKALRKEKDERYQVIKDMAQDLKSLLRRLEFEAELGRARTLEEFKEGRAASRIEKGFDVQDDDTIIEASLSLADELPPNNLSAELSPLIGRAEEIAAIKNLLRQDNVRLLTLSGIGGTGKTRLAQAVAREMLSEFKDGAFFIELSPISDPALVVSEIAQSLGLKEAGGTPLKELLKAYLQERTLFLAIDNFEQVTDAAPLVAELLAVSPRLKVLVTSRALLHLSLEHEFSVPPLALPSVESLPAVDELMRFAAIALFVERARAARPGFALTEENASAV
ncbi:MAG TPA: protein kinase, partial [Pyrinomonadaceae bacterium]|nr:protein kinase [Pyrinomonadaceae bacterium]